jgi:hypothetical protein
LIKKTKFIVKNKIKNMSQNIEKLQSVSLREVWKNEAKDFSSWLFNNIEILGEALNINLTAINKEENVGPFSADIVAEDENGQKVLIENQLQQTDHDHLGKILTYTANLDAKIAIWISSHPREEHEKAIDWLNQRSSDVSFYLVKIEAYKIGNSNPAPKFTIIAEPSEESKAIGEEKKEDAKRQSLIKGFWEKLLEKAKEKTDLHINISPGIYSYIQTSARKNGVYYQYVITNKYGDAQIYLDKGKDFAEPNINKIRFDELYNHKKEIEKIFGGELSWERLDNARASRIAVYFKDSGLANKEKWDELQDKMIDAMVRLEKATKTLISQLP